MSKAEKLTNEIERAGWTAATFHLAEMLDIPTEAIQISNELQHGGELRAKTSLAERQELLPRAGKERLYLKKLLDELVCRLRIPGLGSRARETQPYSKFEKAGGASASAIRELLEVIRGAIADLPPADRATVAESEMDNQDTTRDTQPQGDGTSEKTKPRRRRRKSDREPKPLTPKQAEAVQIVGECKGNIADAARRLRKDRKTVAELYETAMKKLGKRAVQHKTQRLPTDRRGQENVS